MNNAKMWLVVKPTVGIPMFLSAVAIGSFAVHVAVLTNTTWVSDFLSGKPLATGLAAATTDQVQPHVASYLPQGSQEVLVTMPDGTTARAILQMPETMAALK
jgi:light-harvesting protein B-800-850 alpha chain